MFLFFEVLSAQKRIDPTPHAEEKIMPWPIRSQLQANDGKR